MRFVSPVVGLVGSLLIASCSGGASDDCALFCDSWYECTTTAGMAAGSGSCDFPGTSADDFRSLCVPTCEAAAGTLTEAERSDTVDCLECMLGQVTPSECTNSNVADAAFGPCEAICMQPGPDGFLDEVFRDRQIGALCHSSPCAEDADCESGDFCGTTGVCLSPGRCIEDGDCEPDEFCSIGSCGVRP